MYVKANKGVLLCTGGYEGDPQMYRDFNGADTIYNGGSPWVRGDGVKMELAIGAKMWHMDNHTMSCGMFHGIKVPDYETCFIRQFYMVDGGWMETAADGTRYYDEARSYQRQHMKYYSHGQYVDVPIGRSQPVHIIFDEECRLAQPLVNNWIGWPVSIKDAYPWSADNSVEVEKGWIVKADTIEELAELIGKDPAALRAEVDHFNEMVDAGEDTDFGRDIATMAKIDTPPFYAIEEFPAMPACSSGARRNIKSQVLNWDDEPIENLYSAGELGSIVSNLYQNGTYLHEAICTARAAVDTMLGGHADLHPTEGAGVSEPWAEAEDGEYSVMCQGLHESLRGHLHDQGQAACGHRARRRQGEHVHDRGPVRRAGQPAYRGPDHEHRRRLGRYGRLPGHRGRPHDRLRQEDLLSTACTGSVSPLTSVVWF